jgi:hypothetical protein
MPAQTRRSSHLGIGRPDEIQNPRTRQFEGSLTKLLTLAVPLRIRCVFCVYRLDLSRDLDAASIYLFL